MNCFVEYVCSALELSDSKPSVALALACILVDASAKKHYLKTNKKVGSNGDMYKKFIKDYQSIIMSAGSIKNIAKGDIIIGGILLEKIIYKDIRCALLHDAEQKIVMTDGLTGVSGGKVNFCDIVKGLVYSCILAECNQDIKSTTKKKIALNHHELDLDDCWGREDLFWDTLGAMMKG